MQYAGLGGWRLRAVGAALLTLGTSTAGLSRLEARPLHPLHLTVGKVEVEGTRASLEIRIFWDDLQLEVRSHSGNPGAEVRGPGADPDAVTAYINDRLVLEFDGRAVRGDLVEWTLEGDANRYVLRYDLPSPPSRLGVRHRILLDLYEDQKNVLHVQKDGGRQRAFYFARRAEQQTVRF